MSFVSVGDLAQSFRIRRQTADLKTAATRLTRELTTGRVADPGARVGGDFRPLARIEHQLSLLSSYKTTAIEAETAAATAQMSLSRIAASADELSGTLLRGGSTPELVQLRTFGLEARAAFGQAVDALNASSGGRFLFSGAATQTAPLPDGASMLADITAAVAGQTTVGGILDAVDAWFAPGGGYDAAYAGDTAPAGAQRIAPGVDVALGLSAADDGVRNTLRAFATGALLAYDSLLPAAAHPRSELAEAAGMRVLEASRTMGAEAAALGVIQGRIEAAKATHATEAAVLEEARFAILQAEPYETATRLEETTTRLETLYTVTARLARLRLSDYL